MCVDFFFYSSCWERLLNYNVLYCAVLRKFLRLQRSGTVPRLPDVAGHSAAVLERIRIWRKAGLSKLSLMGCHSSLLPPDNTETLLPPQYCNTDYGYIPNLQRESTNWEGIGPNFYLSHSRRTNQISGWASLATARGLILKWIKWIVHHHLACCSLPFPVFLFPSFTGDS